MTTTSQGLNAPFAIARYREGATTRLGVVAGEVFAAGDHLNDLPMLQTRRARWLAAPSNAVEPVKAAVLAQQGFFSRFSHGGGVAEGLELCLHVAAGKQ